MRQELVIEVEWEARGELESDPDAGEGGEEQGGSYLGEKYEDH